MKCKRCGNEMKIKPVEVGKDKQGDPIYHTYAFCYDCKVKVDLDKQREQRTSDPDRERCVKAKRNKKKGGSISFPFKSSGKKKKTKTKTKVKEKKGHGFLKCILFLLVLAVLGTAAYYNRETLKKWAKIGIEKLNGNEEKDTGKEEPIKEPEKEPIDEEPQNQDEEPVEETPKKIIRVVRQKRNSLCRRKIR